MRPAEPGPARTRHVRPPATRSHATRHGCAHGSSLVRSTTHARCLAVLRGSPVAGAADLLPTPHPAACVGLWAEPRAGGSRPDADGSTRMPNAGRSVGRSSNPGGEAGAVGSAEWCCRYRRPPPVCVCAGVRCRSTDSTRVCRAPPGVSGRQPGSPIRRYRVCVCRLRVVPRSSRAFGSPRTAGRLLPVDRDSRPDTNNPHHRQPLAWGGQSGCVVPKSDHRRPHAGGENHRDREQPAWPGAGALHSTPGSDRPRDRKAPGTLPAFGRASVGPSCPAPDAPASPAAGLRPCPSVGGPVRKAAQPSPARLAWIGMIRQPGNANDPGMLTNRRLEAACRRHHPCAQPPVWPAARSRDKHDPDRRGRAAWVNHRHRHSRETRWIGECGGRRSPTMGADGLPGDRLPAPINWPGLVSRSDPAFPPRRSSHKHRLIRLPGCPIGIAGSGLSGVAGFTGCSREKWAAQPNTGWSAAFGCRSRRVRG